MNLVTNKQTRTGKDENIVEVVRVKIKNLKLKIISIIGNIYCIPHHILFFLISYVIFHC